MKDRAALMRSLLAATKRLIVMWRKDWRRRTVAIRSDLGLRCVMSVAR